MSNLSNNARAGSGALLFWQGANVLLAALTGLLLNGPVGAAWGGLLGLAFILAPAIGTHARAVWERIWRAAQPHLATALQRFAGYLPASLLRLFVPRSRS